MALVARSLSLPNRRQLLVWPVETKWIISSRRAQYLAMEYILHLSACNTVLFAYLACRCQIVWDRDREFGSAANPQIAVTSCPKLSWCLSRPVFMITAIKDVCLVQKLINLNFSWRNCNRPELPCGIQHKADILKTPLRLKSDSEAY
jgi:hypothetical protein